MGICLSLIKFHAHFSGQASNFCTSFSNEWIKKIKLFPNSKIEFLIPKSFETSLRGHLEA